MQRFKSTLHTNQFVVNTLCFFVLIKSKENEDEIEILGLINTDTQKYVFLGCSGSHPFIATYDFTFGNSDGSGPIIKHDLLRDQSSDKNFKSHRLNISMSLFQMIIID